MGGGDGGGASGCDENGDVLSVHEWRRFVEERPHCLSIRSRVLLRGGNAAWLVAAWFAVLKAGGVAVTTMPLLREPELKKIIDKCRPSIALCHERVAAPLEAVESRSFSFGQR